MYKRLSLLLVLFFCLIMHAQAQQIIYDKPTTGSFAIVSAAVRPVICTDINDFTLVQKAASLLQQDIELVTGEKTAIVNTLPSSAKTIIIIGSIEKSSLVQQLVKQKRISVDKMKNKWEAYQLQTLPAPFKGIENALVITGSDRRGVMFGVTELSQRMGVSPWYWWADVPVKKKNELYVKNGLLRIDSPLVKYRGIFINDEAPALSNWSRMTFDGFNHRFYEKVFELILRLKGNYIWPAMWGNAFYDDDSLNKKTADDYGIVIGTSHHEPLMRAHDEWRRHGKGRWDYDSNEVRLKQFWEEGMRRAGNTDIIASVGMRGDGDRPMTQGTATALLERIVKDQREIIEKTTARPASQTPQSWALYKEVQDYYDKGMRVPDDVTLLLCDDNWGNIRKLPRLDEKPRAGGYGIYYHFDYVGGPRNYKWLNTNPIPRVWEQMHLAWEYKVRQIWIVNVGDIKPMEFPTSFFLDYAWNPTRIGADDLQRYTQQWAAAQFGPKHATEIADIISKYSKYNGRRKPELLDANTYSLHHYNEAGNVAADYNKLLERAEDISDLLPVEYLDAYFQLVLHPVKACANLQQLYTTVAWNRYSASQKWAIANEYADKAKQLYANDSLITQQYHSIASGKWNHMMSQTHIGYTYWQQPPRQRMPEVRYVPADSVVERGPMMDSTVKSAKGLIPRGSKGNIFYQFDKYVSVEADHFTRALNTKAIIWKILPDHGKTGSAVTPFPVTAAEQKPGGNSPHLEYEVYVYDTGNVKLNAYFSPTLNFYNTEQGLQYAISIDDGTPQIVSINKEDRNTGAGIWNGWVANSIIIKTTNHTISRPGKHIIKYWMVNPAVVLQKIVADFGGVKPSYLGPPETRANY